MGLRNKAFFIGVVMTFYSSFAAALGLGEIKLNSALNQPLDAEVELLHVRDLTERDVFIGLASLEDFKRAGVERNYFLSDLKFTVDLGAKGGPVVRVTTKEPVREPFLDFILSAQWPSGKLLREYTLLIDLPIYAEAKPAPVAAAKKQSSVRAATPQVESPSKAARPVSRPSMGPKLASPGALVSGEEYGPVSSNDTLWAIANRMRPDGDVSIQQTMLAIQRLNPEAFIDSNINLLRRGQILRVPSKDEILALTSREAIREVAQQNSAWGKRSSPSTDKTAQLEGSKSLSSTRTQSKNVEGRIKLSSIDKSDGKNGIGSGDGDSGQSAIEDELATTQEELDAATRESAELKSRIQSMEEQLKTMEKLVEVSNDEMRAIELAAKQAAEQQAPVNPANNAAEEIQEPEVAETTETVSSVADTAAPATIPAQPDKPVAQSATDQWLGLLKDNMLYIAGGVAALVILLAVFLFMRNRSDGFGDDEFEDELEQIRDDFDSPIQTYDESPAIDIDEPEDLVDEFDEDVIEENIHAEAETEDVVGECDIHIAYGQYDQAEDKLIRALEQEPRNVAARLKLLEVFAAQDDIEGFDSHYAKVRVLGDSEAIDRATAMRNNIEGIEPFEESRYDTSAFLAKINEDYERTDTQLDEPKLSENITSDYNYATDDTLKFDFDSDVEQGSEEGVGLDQNDELEFDLDLDDNTRIPGVTPQGVQNADEFGDGFDELDGELDSVEFDLQDEDIELDFDSDDRPLSVASDTSLDQNFETELSDLDPELDDFEIRLEGNDDELSFEQNETGEGQLSSGFDELGLSEESTDSEFQFDDIDDINALSGTGSDDAALDFDLEKDLEEAIAGEAAPFASETENKDASEFDFTDLGDLELDNDQLSEADMDLADVDIELDGEEDAILGAEVDSFSKAEKSDATNFANFDGSDDFDVDYNLEGEVNLDDLDKELDDFDLGVENDLDAIDEDLKDFDLAVEDDSPASSTSSVTDDAKFQGMDEPVTDFDELDLEPANDPIDVQPKEPEVAVVKNTGSDELDFEIPDFDPENDDDSNLDFLSDNDETATKLDLARAYIDMGDADGAKDILDEIVEEGSDTQKKEAETLLAKLA